MVRERRRPGSSGRLPPLWSTAVFFEPRDAIVQVVNRASEHFDMLVQRCEAAFDAGESGIYTGEPRVHVRKNEEEDQPVEKQRRPDGQPELFVAHAPLLTAYYRIAR